MIINIKSYITFNLSLFSLSLFPYKFSVGCSFYSHHLCFVFDIHNNNKNNISFHVCVKKMQRIAVYLNLIVECVCVCCRIFSLFHHHHFIPLLFIFFYQFTEVEEKPQAIFTMWECKSFHILYSFIKHVCLFFHFLFLSFYSKFHILSLAALVHSLFSIALHNNVEYMM